jgi:hypothetical protein
MGCGVGDPPNAKKLKKKKKKKNVVTKKKCPLTFSVLLAALVIKPVSDLMAHNQANRAIVHVQRPVSLHEENTTFEAFLLSNFFFVRVIISAILGLFCILS